jgi:hypothetical protein
LLHNWPSFRAPVRLIRRSAAPGSIPAPACLIEMINSGNVGENAFVTQVNACVFAANIAITSPLYQRFALQDVGSNRFL